MLVIHTAGSGSTAAHGSKGDELRDNCRRADTVSSSCVRYPAERKYSQRAKSAVGITGISRHTLAILCEKVCLAAREGERSYDLKPAAPDIVWVGLSTPKQEYCFVSQI